MDAMGTTNTLKRQDGRLPLIPRDGITLSAVPRRLPEDLSTPSGRLRAARKSSGLTVPQLAERTGINEHTVKKHLRSIANPFNKVQAKSYARVLYPGKPRRWLWLFDGDESDGDNRPLTTLSNRRGKPLIDSSGAGVPMVTIREIDVKAGAGPGGEMPAAYDQLPDGSWIPTEAIAAEVMFPASWLVSLGLDPARTDLVRVEGNSMSPEIEDGDWVFVDRRVFQITADDIYLIWDGNGIVVKSLAIVRGNRNRPTQLLILSANPTFPPQTVPVDDVRIIGRVHYRIGRIVRGRG